MKRSLTQTTGVALVTSAACSPEFFFATAIVAWSVITRPVVVPHSNGRCHHFICKHWYTRAPHRTDLLINKKGERVHVACETKVVAGVCGIINIRGKGC